MQAPAVAPGWKIETRYSPRVLIGNWQEERLTNEKKYFRPITTYSADFKGHPGSRPDVLVRRTGELNCAGLPSGVLFGHGATHRPLNSDLITWYDEDYNRRPREGPNKLPELRSFSTSTLTWIPEKSDYPIQGEPTNYGLTERLRSKWSAENDEIKKGNDPSAQFDTTYRTSYLKWPYTIYPHLTAPDYEPVRRRTSLGRFNSTAPSAYGNYGLSRRPTNRPTLLSASVAPALTAATPVSPAATAPSAAPAVSPAACRPVMSAHARCSQDAGSAPAATITPMQRSYTICAL